MPSFKNAGEAKKALGASFWSKAAREKRAAKRLAKKDELNKKNTAIEESGRQLASATALSKQTGSAMKKPNMSRPAKKLEYIQGSSMGYGKKHGASMNAYQDKEASMDDYSHEKKLKADGRYEAAHGKMANARNDFDHAHALKKDAHHDARGRHAIMKHIHDARGRHAIMKHMKGS